MFKFDFTTDLDDQDLDPTLGFEASGPVSTHSVVSQINLEKSREIPIQSLLDALPTLITYSPLVVGYASGTRSISLPRRDLFDARFQLLSEDVGDPNSESSTTKKSALEFIDSPSDLVRGVYEGGLKTWECSLDLVEYLADYRLSNPDRNFWGKSVLELGCGTALPSTYVLHELCQNPSTTSESSYICLQDYNESVLQLVALPNVLLTWYASPLSQGYRSTANDADIAPEISPYSLTSGELHITPELKSSFLESLEQHNIHLRFVAGAWETFQPLQTFPSPTFDLILSSETIYHSDSLDPLLDVIQTYSRWSHSDQVPTCLIAAKILYFGVGGGVLELIRRCQARKIEVVKVLERNVGVGRQVLSLTRV